MITGPISNLSGESGFENVFISISDSLRYDALPERIRPKGLTTKTIAATPWTAPSIPSLMSGKYPSSHNVQMFEDQLPQRPPLLSEQEDWDAGFGSEKHWLKSKSSEKPPVKMLRLDGEQKFADIEPPLVHVVHDLGPHASYGFENGEYETGPYFRDYNDPKDLQQKHQNDAKKSTNYFLEILDKLESLGLREDTLCVFTSDHGGLLGKGGRLGGKQGHSTPFCPELLEVLMTFIGKGIPKGEILNGVASGVDLALACLSAVGREIGHVDGIDLWAEMPDEDRRVRSDIWQRYNAFDRELPVYVISDLWDNDGGWVKHRRPKLLRMAYYGYDIFLGDYAPPAWSTARISELVSGLKFWERDWGKFGNTTISLQEAQKELNDELVRSGDSVELSEE